MGESKIVPLTDDHLAEITRIHMGAFPGRALTCLGKEAVYRYYQTLLTSGRFRLAVAAHDGEHLLGYLIGGELRGAMTAYLKKNFAYLVFQILIHPALLTQPIVRDRLNMAMTLLKREQSRSRNRRPRPAQKKRTFTVLVIAVDPEIQHRGVGKQLMAHAEAVAIEKAYEQMHLSVDVDNACAIRFYERLGWRRDPEIGWRGSMVKPLAPEQVFVPQGETQVAAQ